MLRYIIVTLHNDLGMTGVPIVFRLLTFLKKI